MKKTIKTIKITVPKTVNKKLLSRWVKDEVAMGEEPYLTLGQIGASCELYEMEDKTGKFELYPFLKSVLKKNPDTRATVGNRVEFVNL